MCFLAYDANRSGAVKEEGWGFLQLGTQCNHVVFHYQYWAFLFYSCQNSFHPYPSLMAQAVPAPQHYFAKKMTRNTAFRHHSLGDHQNQVSLLCVLLPLRLWCLQSKIHWFPPALRGGIGEISKKVSTIKFLMFLCLYCLACNCTPENFSAFKGKKMCLPSPGAHDKEL